jgi:hypothetical protein
MPILVLRDRELRPDEKLTYAFIAAVPGRNPSYAQITASLRFSPKRTARVLRRLHELDWLASQHAPRVGGSGGARFSGPTTYTLKRGCGDWVLMPPGRLRSLVQPRERRSSAAVVLLDLWERHVARSRHQPLTFKATAAQLSVSHDTLARARAVLHP